MIEVRDVTKRFGNTVALDQVSFEVARGKILGFLGPNGAGKSTAMKIITTFLAPDGGQVKVDGIDVLEQPLAVRRRIGYLPENVPLYHDMNVDEYLTFVGQARGLDGAKLRERLAWCVEACGLRTEYKKRIQELSKGYRQRTGLAQALIHDPDILILDEPTSGLDPLQIIGIRKLIASLAGQKTVIFSTHILQEVSPVTERVVIINEGRIVADGRIQELTQQAMGDNRVFVTLRRPAAEVEQALRDLPSVSRLRYLGEVDGKGSRFELRAPFQQDLAGAVAELAGRRGWPLAELHESHYSLEDTFIELTRAATPQQEVA
ncbi:MAG: ATP-binding cassette domain-containing protein [Candidatus Krumholzibacteria bacterium]|nr:ATP-binding cassette domain-containing protein [Candidatus Krumholzibacteria bacterium]